VPGANLKLTIDLNIQLFVEDALRRKMRQTQAKNITAIVMDPRDGAILALANTPDFNPNLFYRFNPFQRRNRAVVDLYEPGSAFKVITAAAALDSGAVSINDHFYSAEGPIKVFGKSIRNHSPYGNLSIPEILWHSSNSGAVQIARSMDTQTFYKYIQAFGFGEQTQVDLPAESNGILRPLEKWEKSSIYFLAMGHEISATPLQMIAALSAVANGGYLVQPYVVAGIEANGEFRKTDAGGKQGRVIKRETATALAQALTGVVERGTATAAAIPGVSVFGKTGTAQRIQGMSYAKDKFNSSFVGFFPAEAPRYGMIVVVHDPRGAQVHGGDVAAPIFSEIGTRIMAYEGSLEPDQELVVFSSAPDWRGDLPTPPEHMDTMPDLSGLGIRNLLYKTRPLDLELVIDGKGRVVKQSPPAGAPIPGDRTCKVLLKEG